MKKTTLTLIALFTIGIFLINNNLAKTTPANLGREIFDKNFSKETLEKFKKYWFICESTDKLPINKIYGYEIVLLGENPEETIEDLCTYVQKCARVGVEIYLQKKYNSDWYEQELHCCINKLNSKNRRKILLSKRKEGNDYYVFFLESKDV